MDEYTIIKTFAEDYDKLVLCLSYESFFSYTDKIEIALARESFAETVLIDQLLITGNGKNRFISCDFSKGKFDFRTARMVNPADRFRKESVQWLHNNYSYVENSILTEDLRLKIKKNIVF